MSDTWGNLKDEEKESIKRSIRSLTDDEIDDRFTEREGVVVFNIKRKTDKAIAEEAIGRKEAAPPELAEYETAEVVLISPEDFDYEPEITADDKEAAQPIDELLSGLEGYYAQDNIVVKTVDADGEAEGAGLPPVVDHRPDQSPIKDQGRRGTCVAHASMGLLEAYGHIPDDLSEQYTHYKFNEFMGRPQDQDAGLRTTDAAPFLNRPDGRVSLEADWPYMPLQKTINAAVASGTYVPPQECLDNQTYGYGAYKIITDRGLTGESIKNTRYLEAFLHQGYNVVIGTWVSWDDKDNDGILDPLLDPSGNPIGRGGHAMVVVGYDRPSQYFIVKNSWGPGWGHNGYAYLHYDLVRSCFKYGFVVDGVVPPGSHPTSAQVS